jgi:hypothetical protein
MYSLLTGCHDSHTDRSRNADERGIRFRTVKRLGTLALLLLLAVPAAAAPPRVLGHQDAWPLWSPDGTKIAFTRLHVPRALAELEVIDVRTHRTTKLAQGNSQLTPSWSPDGTEIAYQSGGDVYVSDLNGKRRRIGKGFWPAFGRSLARVVGADLYVGADLWARKVMGRPAWSPDFKRLAFPRDDGIYVTDGRTEQLVGSTREYESPRAPVWSPDGARLAWVQGGGLWVTGSSTATVAQVGPSAHQLDGPVWDPDGRSLVVMSWSGVSRFFLDGRTQTLHSPSGTGVSVSSSGRLAYVGRRPQCPGHYGIVAGATMLTGTCTVPGTSRADVIEGTPLWGDVLLAGRGNDQVHANDGHTDRVDCGPGRDTAWADRTDRLARCEIVHR